MRFRIPFFCVASFFLACTDNKADEEIESDGSTEQEDTQTGETAEPGIDPDPLDVDDDGDGITENDGDCDDADSSVYPQAEDSTVDGIDQNCDEVDGVDTDGDGYADASGGGDDCDDENAAIFPGASETCNAIDDDCDGLVDSADVCPCNFVSQEGSNYLFCETESVWSEARDFCIAQDNYDLVIVNDEIEQALIWTIATGYGNQHWWLGLHDTDATPEQEPAGGWTWIDGTPVSFSNWAGGQPDNYNQNEDCGHMNTASGELENAPQDGGWNDLPCDQSLWFDPLYFICESKR